MLLEKVMSTRSNDYNIWPKASSYPYSTQKWMYRIWDYGPEMFHIMEPIDSASGSGFQFLEAQPQEPMIYLVQQYYVDVNDDDY